MVRPGIGWDDHRKFTLLAPVSFPHYFLQATGHLAEQLKTREWVVARITLITERVVDHRVRLLTCTWCQPAKQVLQDPSTNPYRLGDGVKYYMLEVEDWTQQTQAQASKRRAYSRRVTSPTTESEPNPALVEEPLPIPAEPEVEESFTTPRPFPARSRANSMPSAGPSSLSRLLAQAPTEANPDSVITLPPESAQPFPEVVIGDNEPRVEPHEQQGEQEKLQPEVVETVSPYPPPIAIPIYSSSRQQSPLRPGSRSSKVSITSRMSIGRKPGGSVKSKASPTTAITGLPVTAGKLPGDSPPVRRAGETPTPEGSSSDGMSNLLKQHHRRRATLSYPAPRSIPQKTTAISDTTNVQGSTDIRNETSASGAGSRLASLANSWGVTFGRRGKTVVLDSIPQASTSSDDQQEGSGSS
jgi:autophagy-related protein 11